MNDLGNKKIMGENIKRQMARLGVSRKEIASALQVPYSTVCEWISGNAYPRIDKIQLLAQYFGITKAQLVEAPGQAPLPDDPPVRDVAQMCIRDRATTTPFAWPVPMAKPPPPPCSPRCSFAHIWTPPSWWAASCP